MGLTVMMIVSCEQVPYLGNSRMTGCCNDGYVPQMIDLVIETMLSKK